MVREVVLSLTFSVATLAFIVGFLVVTVCMPGWEGEASTVGLDVTRETTGTENFAAGAVQSGATGAGAVGTLKLKKAVTLELRRPSIGGIGGGGWLNTLCEAPTVLRSMMAEIQKQYFSLGRTLCSCLDI